MGSSVYISCNIYILRKKCLELSKTFKYAVNVSFFAAKDQTFISMHCIFIMTTCFFNFIA